MPSDHSSGVPLARSSSSSGLYGSQGFVDSPMQIDDISNQTIEDAYDYFGGPDLGEDFSHSRVHISRRRSRTEIRDDDERVEEITRYAEGGASSVTMGRSSSGTWHQVSAPRHDADMPVVVVNEENGAVEERQERSRESSPSAVSRNRLPEEASSPPTASHTFHPCCTGTGTPRQSRPHLHRLFLHIEQPLDSFLRPGLRGL
ncbi:hypothetical protein NUW54_g14761 [Trametes sanguinea]|uniref:Uncharacterized protein n=1 Tax=Trametes sanguinea TaxID=158606 RepID=A0ACC1MCA7_9APHY|nr:hypothetical protein NUW54_g14761 [Trametes sanguinea]